MTKALLLYQQEMIDRLKNAEEIVFLRITTGAGKSIFLKELNYDKLRNNFKTD